MKKPPRTQSARDAAAWTDLLRGPPKSNPATLPIPSHGAVSTCCAQLWINSAYRAKIRRNPSVYFAEADGEGNAFYGCPTPSFWQDLTKLCAYCMRRCSGLSTASSCPPAVLILPRRHDMAEAQNATGATHTIIFHKRGMVHGSCRPPGCCEVLPRLHSSCSACACSGRPAHKDRKSEWVERESWVRDVFAPSPAKTLLNPQPRTVYSYIPGSKDAKHV